jgi:membrane-associated phospholipid phosphatase
MPRLAALLETKWVVSGAAFAVLCWRRDEQTATCILGAVTNAFFSKVLKRLFNAARPAGARLTDPGMPSSHAQSLFFFSTYLSLLARTSPTLDGYSARGAAQLRIAAPVAVTALACYLSHLRVRAGLHTTLQVVVGAGFGSAMGAAWLFTQPTIERWFRAQMDTWRVSSGTALFGLLLFGIVLVGSMERLVATKLKRR